MKDEEEKLGGAYFTVTNAYAYKNELEELSRECEGRDRELAETISLERDMRSEMDDTIAKLAENTSETVVAMCGVVNDILDMQGEVRDEVMRLKCWLSTAIGMDVALVVILLVRNLM